MLSKLFNLVVSLVAAFVANWLVVRANYEILYLIHRRYYPSLIDILLRALRAILQLAIVAGFCLFGIAPFMKQNYTQLIPFLQKKLGIQATYLLIASIVTLIGFGAFYFKKWNKKLYGEVEVMIGISTAFVVAQSMNGRFMDLAKWSTLAGSAYVIARGLGNRDENADPYRNGSWQVPPSRWRPNVRDPSVDEPEQRFH